MIRGLKFDIIVMLTKQLSFSPLSLYLIAHCSRGIGLSAHSVHVAYQVSVYIHSISLPLVIPLATDAY